MGTLDVVYRLLGVNETLDKMCDDVRDAMMALESERDAAVRRAEAAEAAEAALASARVEGAREARRQAHNLCREMMLCASPLGTDEAPYDAWIRTKFPEFYPAAAPVPETRPAVAPEPPQRVVLPVRAKTDPVLTIEGQEAPATLFAYITPADARRIVSLAAQDGETRDA